MKHIQARWFAYDQYRDGPSGYYSVDCRTLPDAVKAILDRFDLSETQLMYLNNFKFFVTRPKNSEEPHLVGIWCWAGPRGWIGPDWG